MGRRKQENYSQPAKMTLDIENLVTGHGGIRSAARALGYSPAYLSQVCTRNANAGEELAKLVGWKKFVIWKKNA